MTVARIYTSAINGIDAEPVVVEVDTAAGVPVFNIVGLPDATITEAKERVKSAIKNAGFAFPMKKVLINLAPADTRKVGSAFDLPMAVGILHSSEYFPVSQWLEQACFVGELSLDGTVRPIKGALAIALMARANGYQALIVPQANVAEASLVEGITVYGIENLSQVPQLLDTPTAFQSQYKPQALLAQVASERTKAAVDFNEIKGQPLAKRALEIAAAGGHNVAFFGPPGSGKSMLAKAFTGILPPMDFEEMLEVSRIYSVSGLLGPNQFLVPHRPFRSPHHSASAAGITGGGSYPKPGEITLAHRGVLFLDEFPEFPRNIIDVLRQPLEDGLVTVSRAQQSLTFPASFILVAAMNPCPCGYKGDSLKACTCSAMQIQRYLSKISGPVLDRIDLQLEVPRLSEDDLLRQQPGLMQQQNVESSETIRQRVIQARQVQEKRFAAADIRTNSEMSSTDIKKFCILDDASEALMRQAVKRFQLSGRAFDRLLKITRTIADLEGCERIQSTHLAEALQYRGLYKLFQGQPHSAKV